MRHVAVQRDALRACQRKNGGKECVQVCWVCSRWGLLNPGGGGGSTAEEIRTALSRNAPSSGRAGGTSASRGATELSFLEKLAIKRAMALRRAG